VRPLPRRDRILVILWIVLSVALWNAIFEMLVDQGVKLYLYRAAMHDAGRAPFVAIGAIMDPAIYRATWVATMWTSVVLLAAMITIRYRLPAGPGAGQPHFDRVPKSTVDG
jgi:hypothetical protein